MSSRVIRCGDFEVRSHKADKRKDEFLQALKRWGNDSDTIDTSYRTRGIESGKIQIWNEHYNLIEAESEEIKYIKISKIAPVFYDQTAYTFSIKIEDAEEAWVFSTIATLCESSDWDSDTKKLNIPVNFGNDLGDFEICWEWRTADGEVHSASFGGEVYSTKLDIYSHFKTMLSEVQNKFDWVELDILRQTAWGWSKDSDTSSGLMKWLQIFLSVRERMYKNYKKLINEHRKRLKPRTAYYRADRIKKLSSKLEEKVAESLNINPNKKYAVPELLLDADTQENRYMKFILHRSSEQLFQVIERIRDNERISDVFKDRLGEWLDDWDLLKLHYFWRGIGNFQGLKKDSKVLSQDPVYSGIRHSWILLQQGLKFFEDELKAGIQNAAQLYEFWCYVKLDEILYNMGWNIYKDLRGETLNLDDDVQDFEKVASGTLKRIYTHKHIKDVELSLLFQPIAGQNRDKSGTWEGIKSVPVTQKPDIVLRLHRNDLPKMPVYTWIFDAKYRIEGELAPDDAVNQMHRYRDAILWASETEPDKRLLRESIGAFVLYPGEEKEDSKQIKSIEEVNIGAFPLKPPFTAGKIDSLLEQKIRALLPSDNSIQIDTQNSTSQANEPLEAYNIEEVDYYKSVPGDKRDL